MLVVAETKFRSIDPQCTAAVFASTHPLEPVRVLYSLAMSFGVDPIVRVKEVMKFLDISRAQSPERHPEHRKDHVGRLLRLPHGERDASQNFELRVVKVCGEGGAE